MGIHHYPTIIYNYLRIYWWAQKQLQRGQGRRPLEHQNRDLVPRGPGAETTRTPGGQGRRPLEHQNRNLVPRGRGAKTTTTPKPRSSARGARGTRKPSPYVIGSFMHDPIWSFCVDDPKRETVYNMVYNISVPSPWVKCIRPPRRR